MRKLFIPKEYQPVMTDYIIRNPRCAVWAGMGLGKTVATLNAIDILHFAGLANIVLVVAPLRVAQSTWPDEAEKWEHLTGTLVIPIVGNAAQRERTLARHLPGKQVGKFVTVEKRNLVFTINYENLPWLISKVGETWPFDMVVADESTKLKGFRLRQGTQRAKALARVAWRHVKRFVELTGTPSPNGTKDLWGQAWFLDAGERLGRTYDAFSQRWFQKSFDGFGMDLLPGAHEHIISRLKDLCISLDAKDYFDLRDPIVNIIEVELPPAARATYREMEREMFMQLEDDGINHEVEAFNAASRTMKCLQLASGAAYVGGSNEKFVEVHKVKLDALEDVIEEAAGMPVLVAYHFRSDLARLQKHFPKAKVLDKNPQTLRDWNAGKIPILLAHPASAGHGLNLQDGGNILVFFSHNWNLEEYMQIIERIGPTRQLQAGHDRPVFIHHIVAKNTVDEMVMARRDSKREVQDILLEAMKAREAR